MERIKAIQTPYKGYMFRLRLEARWAVFFDALGIRYQYEPEGLELPDGTLYLPDFYLPDCKTFFEVKGLMTDKDMHKIEQLINTGRSVAIGFDAANDEAGLIFRACDYWGISNKGNKMYSLASELDSVFCRCHACGKYFFTGRTGCWDCTGCGNYDGDHDLDFLMDGDGAITGDIVSTITADGDVTISLDRYAPEGKIRTAVKMFKQARFEHGEAPEKCSA